MMIGLSNFVFVMSLFTGTIISISSSSWLGMWIGIEMNLLSFIPLINKYKTPYETESSMKYFLVQAMGSVLFLMSIMLSEMNDFTMNINSNSYLMSLALLMKMGAAPMHFWFPGVMEGIDWMNCIILMTWQKLAPFIILSYKILNNMIMWVIFLSVLIGSIGGLNQNSLRKIMAYSSISHLGWMLSAMLISNNMWMLYFTIYTLMNVAVIYIFNNYSVFYLSQMYFIKNKPTMKFSMMISMLSLAGLPPFLGFLPKWLVIQNLMFNNMFIMTLVMIMTTLLTLYFYMRIMFSSFMFTNQEMKWYMNTSNFNMLSLFMMISTMGIPLLGYLYMY
uniref:NADH-ubiquinone oxidoreductase chain 2 n=1 Tax=Brachythemis contaminata TaxID=342759 RepID=A0A0U1YW44_BRACT|nr:NADH dehydrogenase subunit 2 [Brachythemis contaminata]AJE75776.1 NADH dehydrogenase subunit 2 [Brachythemis contaminata]